MAATAIMAIGLGLTAAGAAGQYVNTQKAVGQSRRAERLREQMMIAETQRRQRELMRQSILANAMSRARATNQGVSLGSSAVSGAYGQTAGEVGRQGTALFENQVLGSGIFDANRKMANFQGQAQMWNQIGQVGNFMMGNSQKIVNTGQTAFSMFSPQPPTTQASWNLGTGVQPTQYSSNQFPATFSFNPPTPTSLYPSSMGMY